MKEVILVKYGEIALKGLNKSNFENALIKNIRRRISALGSFNISRAQSTLTIEPENDMDLSLVVSRLKKVFGIASFSRALVVQKDMDAILPAVAQYLKDELGSAGTFKVEAKRSDKKFSLNSPQICAVAGQYILENFPNLTVDVNNPDVTVTIEIRDLGAYIRGGKIQGAKGMPAGTAGKAMLLVSGGIDSPVAGYMMAKRGLELCAVHFASPPYTSERAKQKVIDLVKQLSYYCGRIKLFIVPFTRVGEQIRSKCPLDLNTIIMRRFMMKIAEKMARDNKCLSLITGESLGQVASQTMQALYCTDKAVSLPVFRPLIGFDKDEIIEISREIGTFPISIQPYEDCCTIFTPKHPKTKPDLKAVIAAEQALDVDALVEECVDKAVWLFIEG